VWSKHVAEINTIYNIVLLTALYSVTLQVKQRDDKL
jgi:hypothetical protein